MTLEEAKRHAEHLCDVWPIDENDEHCGVIIHVGENDMRGQVLSGGHPEYGPRWFSPAAIETNCQIKD